MMKMKRSASPYSSFETSCEDEIIAGEFEFYGEKKLKCRRLNMEQVRALEKSFELGKRLEPERKLKLARALGLHPRQIAIWFQNRRARWKTKQLEKDFGVLKQDYEAFKAHYHNLQEENKKLQTEIQRLSNIFKNENAEKVGVEAENMRAMDEGICGALQFGSCGQEKEVGSTSSMDGSLNHRVLAKLEQNMAEQTEETCFYSLDEKTRFLWDHWP